jgi:hypothetical protein
MSFMSRLSVVALTVAAGLPLPGVAQEAEPTTKCRTVQADMTESRKTVGCKPEHDFCFLGEVTGPVLTGTTYFKGDSSAPGPATSPGFIIYSGVFEYTTPRGKLIARETGVINQTKEKSESGALTAHQQIIKATGELQGTTGDLFVSGFNRNERIRTTVTGQLCTP